MHAEGMRVYNIGPPIKKNLDNKKAMNPKMGSPQKVLDPPPPRILPNIRATPPLDFQPCGSTSVTGGFKCEPA